MAKILIVDDRPTNRQFLATLLGYGNHRLLEAADGAEALKLVREERPDIVISDILMPTMDGFEFAKSVRADPDIKATKIIFYTAAYRAQEARLLATACGVSTVIAKPADPQRVLDVVNKELGIASLQSIPQFAVKPVAQRQVDVGELSQLGVVLTDYVNDLRGVKTQFDGVVERGLELEQERERLQGLSSKFAQNLAQLHTTSTRLSALVELGMDLSAERDPQRLLHRFAAATRRIVGSRSVVAMVLNTTENRLQHLATDGLGPEAAAAMDSVVLDQGLVGQLLAAQKPIRLAAPQGEKTVARLPVGHPAATSFLGVAIGTGARCYGFVFCADKLGGGGEFADEDEKLALALAGQLAVIYENFELYDMLQRHAAQLQVDFVEHKRTQEALSVSEAGLRRAQLMAKLGHIIARPDGSFESWSEALPELIGVESARMPRSTRDWLELLHPDDRVALRNKAIEAAANGTRADMEYRVRRADGTWRHVRHVMEPIGNEADPAGMTRWFNTLQDVSEQNQAEMNLRESELRFRQLAENIHQVFFLINPAGTQMLYVSPAYEHIWRRSTSSLYANPQSWTDPIHPDDKARVFASFEHMKNTGRLDYEYRMVRADGTLRWIHARGFPIRNDAGEIYRIAGIAEDITDRKQAAEELRESERRFSNMLGNVQLVSLMLDRKARITYCNDYLLRLTGWRREEVTGRNWFELFLPPENTEMKTVRAALLADSPSAWHYENEILTRSGERRLIRWNNSVLRSPAGEVIGTASIGEDITEQKRAEVKIRRLNRVYAVLGQINALIVRVRDREELFREACRIAVEQGQFRMAWIGMAEGGATHVKPIAWAGEVRGFFDSAPLAAGKDRRQGLAWQTILEKKALVANDVQTDARTVMKNECMERGIKSLAMLPLVVAGEGAGVLALYAADSGFFDDDEVKLLLELAGDISFALEHIANTERLDYLAYYDELTGLANRKLFLERAEQKLLAAGGVGRKVALLLLDVERFKGINDALGRQAGDELLKEIADRMTRAGGDATRIARIGANHFAIVVVDEEVEEQLARLVERTLEGVFGSLFRVGGSELRVSAKVGIAVFPSDGADAETLFRNAEAAVRKAKSSGERYVFYTQQMTERVAEKLALESKLRQALEKEEFVLHYQPKVDLATRSIVGLEALIRWQSPELGLVPPANFIPLLEETGLILPVGAWALRQAARAHRAWTEQGLKVPRVAVNVSAIQLRQRDFVAAVEQAILEGLAPTGIDLEITESVIMQDVDATIEKLKEVRALGLKVAIDDFGTGYSSLAYLAKLPVETLKIDRSFIITMLENPNTMTLVRTMISLAHSLRMVVVAEGVDAEEQAKVLRLLGCDQMQGYLFSKPVPAAAIVAMLGQAAAGGESASRRR